MKTIMNRIFKTLAIAMAAIPLLCSCSDKEEGEGRVSFVLLSDEALTDITRSQVSDYTTIPSVNDFTIVVTDSKENEIYNGPVGSYPTSKALNAGNYSVKATYGSVTDEGFDKPCFVGSQDFTITGGSTNEVSISVKLANAIVKVECTEMFKEYFTDYSFTLKTGNGTSISYPKTETRAAFIDAYTLSVEGTLVNQGGKPQTFSKNYTSSLSAATCYTLKFDASNVGKTSITITFDNSTDDVDLGSIELN